MNQVIDKKKYWVNAETIMEKTGWTAEDMRRERINNPSFWRQVKRPGAKKAGYVYDISLLPESLIKK